MNKILSYLNILSFFGVVYLIIRFVYSSFFLNSYELLFMDERLIINDIYNVWNLDDEFSRFSNIKDKLLKSSLIVLTEISYGGDLRYGRIWSNIFIVLLGPFTFFNDQVVITTSRIITIFTYFISINLLINELLNKRYRWIYCLIFYSIPGVFYFNTLPKPDSFVILFIAIAIIFFRKNENKKAIFFLGLATGTKVVGIFALLFSFIYLFKKNKTYFRINNLLRLFSYSFLGFIVANPILIIPPINIGSLPNFYSIYYNWINSQSLVAQSERFSSDYFITWGETMSSYFTYGLITNISLTIVFIIFTLYLVLTFIKNKEYIPFFVTSTGLSHLLFIFSSVERQWKVYLNYSYIFIFLGFIYFINSRLDNSKKILFLFYLLIVPLGFMRILIEFNDTSSPSLQDLSQIPIVVETIEELYTLKGGEYNLVLWDPSNGMPRNGVTYNSFFNVREKWEGSTLENILNKSDFYVSKEFMLTKDFEYYLVGDFYIYSKKSNP